MDGKTLKVTMELNIWNTLKQSDGVLCNRRRFLLFAILLAASHCAQKVPVFAFRGGTFWLNLL